MRHTKSQLTVFFASMLLAVNVLAQAWPSKAITLIIPFPPGSGNDIIGRLLGPQMSSMLGQPVVLENRLGAAGNIGMDVTAKAPPDGYTLVLGSSSHTVNLYTLKGTAPFSAFTPLALIGKIPLALIVNPGMPARNVQELINEVRAHKGKYNASAGGATGTGFVAVESFKRFVGPELELVVYKGGAEAQADLLAGRIHMNFGNVSTVLQSYRAGKLRLLAIAGSKRSELVPEVPTFTEQGFPQFDISIWYGLLGAAGIARPVVNRLNETVNKALTSKEMTDKLRVLGVDTMPGSPEQLGTFLQQDSAMWEKRVKESGVELQ